MRSFNRIRAVQQRSAANSVISTALSGGAASSSSACGAVVITAARCQSSSTNNSGGDSNNGWDNASWGGKGDMDAASSWGGGAASSTSSSSAGRWGSGSATDSSTGGWGAAKVGGDAATSASSSWGAYAPDASAAGEDFGSDDISAANATPGGFHDMAMEDELDSLTSARIDEDDLNGDTTNTPADYESEGVAVDATARRVERRHLHIDNTKNAAADPNVSFMGEASEAFNPNGSAAMRSAKFNDMESKRKFEEALKAKKAEGFAATKSDFGNEAARNRTLIDEEADLLMDTAATAAKGQSVVEGSGTADVDGVVSAHDPVTGRVTNALGPQKDSARPTAAPIDVAARYDPRLSNLPNASVDGILQLQPMDAVAFAASYAHMQHLIRNLRRRRVRFINPIFLTPLKEEALLSAAIGAVEKKSIPLDVACNLLKAPMMSERLAKYRRYISTLIRSWTVEAILSDALTPPAARRLLRISGHFGRDARVIGSLAQKAVEDIVDGGELASDSNAIIEVMFSVASTHVCPPASFWTLLLRRLTTNMSAANTKIAAGEAEFPEEPANSRRTNVLTPRQIYRILDCCARVGVFSDINMLAQLAEHAWHQIAKRAAAANFKESTILKPEIAINRLYKVSELTPHQFFRLIQISSTLGTNFNAGRGVITDQILIPLSFHLNDHHTSELIEALALAKARYAPALQAVIDRVVIRKKSHATLLHVSRILRLIAQHNDLCAQLRLAKFFDVLEHVCAQKQTLRTIQMARIIEDIYCITRRFARTAPIVVRMQKIIEEFCGTFCIAVKRGVVAIDQVNLVLEHTIMMGMAKEHADQFPNAQRLREMRKELYQNTKPGAFPAGYKDRVDPSVRFLYNDLVYVNQSQSLFNQQADRATLAQLQALVAAAGPVNTIRAALIYKDLHGTTMPLSAYLQSMLVRHLKHLLADVKTGDTVDDISKKVGYPRGKKINERDLLIFAAAISRKALPYLKKQGWYLEFLNAAAVALGGFEELQLKINTLQRSQLVDN